MASLGEFELNRIWQAAQRGERVVFEALVYQAAKMLEIQRRQEFLAEPHSLRGWRAETHADASDGRTCQESS